MAETDRATTTQAVFSNADGLFEIDGDNPPLRVADPEWRHSGWIGPDRDLLLSNGDALALWSPSAGIFADANCLGCRTGVEVGDEIAAITSDRVLRVFDAATLEPLRTIETDLPGPDNELGTTWVYVFAAEGREVFVIQADPAGTAAYGGPESILAVDVATGAARAVANTSANTGITHTATNADGTLVAIGGAGWRGGFCIHDERVTILDLATSEYRDLPPLVDGPMPDDFEVRVVDLFWNGPTLYAVWSLIWTSPFDGEGCETLRPTALYRLVDDQWEVVDSGPLGRVRPMGQSPGQKVVTVAGGDLYAESGGVGELVATGVSLVASTPTTTETDLTPPSPPAVVRETQEAILAAAEAGDIDALVALTGPDFSFTFGDPSGGPAAVWEASDPTSAMIAVLTAPSERRDGEYYWGDQPNVGCRAAISDEGIWLFFVCGD